MTTRTGEMHLGAFLYLTGHHVAAWRHPMTWAGDTFSHYADFTRKAEAAKFDAIFIADIAAVRLDKAEAAAHSAHSGISHFEPLTLLSALAVVTQRIGLIGTGSTSFNDPYNLARQFASLDHLSNGRVGWNAVTSSDPNAAPNFGHAQHIEHSDRYQRAEEFADVVLKLWDSFDDDAFTRNRETGEYFDLGKMHAANHKGTHFSVAGPLNIPRSSQGRPVVVQAGSSDAGKDLAARTAEVVFTVQSTLDGARSFYSDVKSRAAAYGRNPEKIKIMPGLLPIVGKTREEAQGKYDELQSLISPEVGLSLLEGLAGRTIKLSDFPLDGPLPELPPTSFQKSRQAVVLEVARRENLTIRQLYLRLAGSRGHLTVIGTAQDVADQMQAWFEDRGADGFNVMPATIPGGLDDFAELVIPELQRRKLFRVDYQGETLRDHLGLDFPEPIRASRKISA
ncbi:MULTISPECIES: LLM class flavin-dependent oxidoreductase [Agrobacterium]|uniref:LLM class flavin-dependent oxidoreductase n=1 Tax=Agrobacterium TaxID=357 RepID=UPI0009BBCEEC|nr:MULTISPECIES: LLM class flavin-dependent oxidoreductase [Agrobacterium]QCL77430.1 LLM class flavin-dependent oxidoreductase [Agrobacterium tumefaciens]CUX72246.1 nitrilotriacetate monooxygenase component A (NTA monooxygenase component A) (NTA-MO A) [Agrobacterium sp. NCPPB 925]